VSWDEDLEYSNGANGFCQDCGAATDEPWHAYCSGCYAQQQGWTSSRRNEDDGNASVEELVPRSTRQAGHTSAWLKGYHAGYQQGVQDARTGRAA
jgi:hypothetical protein